MTPHARPAPPTKVARGFGGVSTGISLTPARLRMLRRLCVLRAFYVSGADVRAAKWLAARGLVALEDNGSLRGPKFYTARTKRAVNSLTIERGPKAVPHE